MNAAFFKEHGGADRILYGAYRDPVAGPGEVVVRVRACGLNHVDLLLLDGRFPPPEGLPHVNGCEVTGTLETFGPDVKGLPARQRVIVFPGFSCGTCEYCLRGERTVCVRYGYLGAHRDGGYAELVTVPAANVLPLPEAISFEAGAALPLAMLTAWHALVARADVRPGQTVLVQAAGSGVGSAAIQIARLCGARVAATVGSDEKIDLARALGAEEVINYRTQDFVEAAKRWTGKRGVDVVVEHIGGDTFERSVYALTRSPSARTTRTGAGSTSATCTRRTCESSGPTSARYRSSGPFSSTWRRAGSGRSSTARFRCAMRERQCNVSWTVRTRGRSCCFPEVARADSPDAAHRSWRPARLTQAPAVSPHST
jgi:NADPH:quinone reductase-like Zn-dependent oxidoreductase